MPLANQHAWITQNKGFIASTPPKQNAWLKPTIQTIRMKSASSKTDDKSTSTINTTTSNRDELDTIQQTLSALQSAELQNKKMRDSFDKYCAEKRQNTIKAKSDIDHLKDITHRLVQTTADLQQQLTLLQADHFKEGQRLESRITGLENSTHALAVTTQTTSTNVHDIKSHLETLHNSLESSTKKAVTDTVNTALQSFMLKFTSPKRLRNVDTIDPSSCPSPEHKKPASLPNTSTSDRALSQQKLSFTPCTQDDQAMPQSVHHPGPPDPHPGTPQL